MDGTQLQGRKCFVVSDRKGELSNVIRSPDGRICAIKRTLLCLCSESVLWHVSVASTFKLEVTHGWDLERGRRALFADVASTKAAIDNDAAKVEITSVEFSISQAEQTDAGAALPRAFSFL